MWKNSGMFMYIYMYICTTREECILNPKKMINELFYFTFFAFITVYFYMSANTQSFVIDLT